MFLEELATLYDLPLPEEAEINLEHLQSGDPNPIFAEEDPSAEPENDQDFSGDKGKIHCNFFCGEISINFNCFR